jgi:hypothetical protein
MAVRHRPRFPLVAAIAAKRPSISRSKPIFIQQFLADEYR